MGLSYSISEEAYGEGGAKVLNGRGEKVKVKKY
jgi:hypothetical protein